jgi:hypothetical protein
MHNSNTTAGQQQAQQQGESGKEVGTSGKKWEVIGKEIGKGI